MKFQEHFDKMVWTLITAGIITLVGLVGTVAWTASTQVRTVRILDGMELRMSAVETEQAVRKALAEERNKPQGE